MSDALPRCYNRAPFRDTIEVQDGWHGSHMGWSAGDRRMVKIPNPMSKQCQQWGDLGVARIHKWNCEGCRWKP